MHGRIFVIVDEDSLKNGDRFCPFVAADMVDWIPGCEYVVKESERDFKESLNWLSECLNFDLKIEFKDLDGKKVLVGTISQDGVKGLIQAIEEEKKIRLRAIREELKKENPDMWRIAYLAYNNNTFYFVLPQGEFSNEMDFLKSLRQFQKEYNGSLFITESYGYQLSKFVIKTTE